MAEVDEVTDGLTGEARVVEELRLVLGRQFRQGFKLHHQAAEDEQVGVTLIGDERDRAFCS